MARKRMIDPSIWQDEGMAELTPRQQLLYIGLFSSADDDGRLKGSAAYLRLILPTLYGGEPLEVIERDLDAVVKQMGCLTLYEVDDKSYIAFSNYEKWQKIDRPYPSLIPPPDVDSTNDRRTFDEHSTNDRRPFAPNKNKNKNKNKKGREEEEEEEGEGEGEGEGAAAAAAPPLRSAALRPDQHNQANAFHACLVGIPRYAPSDGFLAKVVTKYGELDLEEIGIAIASYAKSRPKWFTEAAVFTWLRKDLERLHAHSDDGLSPNGAGQQQQQQRSYTAGQYGRFIKS